MVAAGPRFVVAGSLNTDIVAQGLPRLPGRGQHAYGERLLIGPGGKSRNIAAMIAGLVGPGRVAMIGRTVRDSYGLWKVPLEALQAAGVATDQVQVAEAGSADELPGVALIAVEQSGQNQIIVLPGASQQFSAADVDRAAPLFAGAGEGGVLAMSLECPRPAAARAMAVAKEHGLRTVLDPGGLQPGQDISDLLAAVEVIKPNEHEAEMLTGVAVMDLASARKAGTMLLDRGVGGVVITAGEAGAFAFTRDGEAALPVPELPAAEASDATGCGDQATAAICVALEAEDDLLTAAELGVLAGSLQFGRAGIQPVEQAELAMARRLAKINKKE